MTSKKRKAVTDQKVEKGDKERSASKIQTTSEEAPKWLQRQGIDISSGSVSVHFIEKGKGGALTFYCISGGFLLSLRSSSNHLVRSGSNFRIREGSQLGVNSFRGSGLDRLKKKLVFQFRGIWG